jgi:histolysain
VGGNPLYAYAFVLRQGLTSEAKYPYVGAKGTCSHFRSVSGITGFRSLLPNEAALKLGVSLSPVAVGVSGTSPSFLMYKGGLYDDPDCTGDPLNHAMLLTGKPGLKLHAHFQTLVVSS